MIRYSLLVGIVIICLYSCENDEKLPEKGSCKATIKVIAKRLHDGDGNVFYNVTGFDATNTDCLDYLKRWGEGASKKYAKPAVTIHFLGDAFLFKPTVLGDLYGDDEVRRKVILQYITKVDGDTMLVFFPFGKEAYATQSSTTPALIDTVNVVQRVQKQIDYFEKEFDNSVYRGHPTKIEAETVAFALWAGEVDVALKDTSEDVRKLGNSFKKKLTAFQVKEFPVMRKAFTEELRKILWEHDIDVKVQGKGFTTLNLVGGIFAANKNFAETHQTIEKQVYNLRFKQVRYRWYDGADEFTYFDLKPPKDSDLVQAYEMRQ